MAKGIDIKKMAEDLDMDYYNPVWFKYSLGKDFGTRGDRDSKRTKYTKLSARSTTNKDMFVNKVISSMNDLNFKDILGFYPLVLAYVFAQRQEKIKWVEGSDFHHAKLNKCVKELTLPVEFKSKLEDLWSNLPDFGVILDEIEDFGDSEINYASMKDVYKLQGDEAIFGILAQIFGDFPYSNAFSCHLLPHTDIIWTPEIDSFVTGCVFPVCVSPCVNDFRVSRTNNGTILQAFWRDKWWDFDIFEVGQWNLWRETLNQRRNYLKNEKILPCLVCNNWLEVALATKKFGGNVIVREFGQNLINNRWFRFGGSSQIAVRLQNRRISAPGVRKTVPNMRINDSHGCDYVFMTLGGEFVREASKQDVVFAFDELCDWFELASLCRTI